MSFTLKQVQPPGQTSAWPASQWWTWVLKDRGGRVVAVAPRDWQYKDDARAAMAQAKRRIAVLG